MIEPLSHSDFLYAKGSDRKWYALYKGEIKEEKIDTFYGSTFDDTKCDRIIWGSVSNPATYPNEVPYNPIQSTIQYYLNFENKIPEEWLERDFRLTINGKEFMIESACYDSNGNCYVSAVTNIKYIKNE